jgi:hypothetical protein
MAARGRSLSGMGYTGYPATIFIERMNYGYGNRSHMENKITLEKWYSALYCYLPVLYDKKMKEYEDLKINDLLLDAEEEINAMGDLYDASFEDTETCNPEEKTFLFAMRGVFERLDRITAITHVIDGIKPQEDGGFDFVNPH